MSGNSAELADSNDPRPLFCGDKIVEIPLAKPFLDGSELAEIEKVLRSGWITQGPAVAEFERNFAGLVDAKYAVATSNCTTAMHIAWTALGIGAGHEVICPSYSFIASANAIRHAGAEPCFVDIDASTLNLDAKKTHSAIKELYDAELVNKQTGRQLKAILLVHQIGIPCDLDAFAELSSEFGLPIVEDAACAVGSSYKGMKIGGSGNLCAFSFHPRKVITTGEGGMLCSSSIDLAQRAQVLRAHGMSLSDLARHRSSSTTFEQYEILGYNYRMTDIQAALGLAQLKLLEGILRRRAEIAARFDSAFSCLPGVSVLSLPDYVSCWNRQSYPIRIDKSIAVGRNELMDALGQKGISTRRGIPPIHQEPLYNTGQTLPVTEAVSQSSLFLPIYPQLEDWQVDYIIDSVIKCHRACQ